jgi:hypothetical protein
MDKQINFIVKFWHIIVVIVSFVFSLGLIYGVNSYRLTQVEDRVTDLEQWKEARIELLHRVEIDVAEIKTKTNYIYDELVARQDKLRLIK